MGGIGMNKIVGITTFCSWTSYGSILQAFALKMILNQMGNDSYVLIDRPVTLPEAKCHVFYNKGPKQFVVSFLNSLKKKEIIKQYNKNNNFIKKYIKIIYYNNYEELAMNYLKADYYLAGSDQVFNPVNPRPGLFLDYVDDKSKNLTYACSMGKTQINPNVQERFSKYINNFKIISVREEDNIKVLKEWNPEAIYLCHIDPTFLISKDEWRALEVPYQIEERYVLVYPLYWDKKNNKYLKRLHKKGFKIVGIFGSLNHDVYCNKALYDVGVQEFLWLVDHADAVITSSFHGLAFSTIFEKKVSVVINPDMSSRLNHLMNLLGIENCLIEQVIDSHQDYELINSRIGREQERSLAYLKEILHEE